MSETTKPQETGAEADATDARPKRLVTPDGRSFTPSAAARPLRALSAGAMRIVRFIGKTIATIWRMAGALDAALWRGFRLIAVSFWRSVVIVATIFASAIGEFLAWLPSRGGRAYCAASAVVLVVASLWILDELRSAPSGAVDADGSLLPPVDLEDPILARLEGRYIHLSDIRGAAITAGLIGQEDALSAADAFDRQLVDTYIEQRLLARAALESGLQRDPLVSRRIRAATERLLASAYLDGRISSAVTDDAVRRLYEGQSDVVRLGDEVRARHILVADQTFAAELAERIRGGESFAALARELSIDRATAPVGGEMGYFTRHMMTPAIARVAFSLQPGALSEPFETEHGWNLIEVLDRRPARSVAFAEVEEEIRRFLRLKVVDDTLAGLKEEAEVSVYPPPAASTEAGPAGPDRGE